MRKKPREVIVAARVSAEDAPLARKIWAGMYLESMGEEVPGYREHELLQTPYTTGDGDIEYYMCIVDGTKHHHKKYLELIKKHKLVEQCPSFIMPEINSKEEFLAENNMREVK